MSTAAAIAGVTLLDHFGHPHMAFFCISLMALEVLCDFVKALAR